MDGELDGAAAEAAIDAVQREGEEGDAWRTYHLIRDAMTDTRLLSSGFSERMAERLAAEPTVLAPARAEPRRWLPVAAAASAAFALVGWLAFAPQPGVAPQVAQAPAPAVTAKSEAPKEEPRAVAATPIPHSANDYMLAHQGFSPRMALQGMAPYVRTVSGER
jgi:sigma-E factor negative regulatory protein RseA